MRDMLAALGWSIAIIVGIAMNFAAIAAMIAAGSTEREKPKAEARPVRYVYRFEANLDGNVILYTVLDQQTGKRWLVSSRGGMNEVAP